MSSANAALVSLPCHPECAGQILPRPATQPAVLGWFFPPVLMLRLPLVAVSESRSHVWKKCTTCTFSLLHCNSSFIIIYIRVYLQVNHQFSLD